MKKMLVLLLLFPLAGFAQINDLGIFLKKESPDSTARFVFLPTRNNLYQVMEIGHYSSYTYVVSEDSVYYKIFAAYSKDSLPAFDFNKQELVVYTACSQCLSLRMAEKTYESSLALYNKPKHRNACRYHSVWYVRDKREKRKDNSVL